MAVTFHDMFCGAGGSTLGAIMAGAKPVVGMNHWPVACQSYEANHASHGAVAACVDVVTQDPRYYPKADMLLASPECTHHSYARGKPKDDPSLFDPAGDMAAERSRATMWDVVRFAEVHEYKAIIVENVEAAIKWGLPRGQKLKHGDYGPLFTAWLLALEGLGYRYRIVHLNSMVCGVPQSRDRLYVVFWRKGIKEPDLDIPALAWCPRCQSLEWARQTWKRPGTTTGTHGSSYFYACPRCASPTALAVRPAAQAIDWALTAPKISDRTRPLKPATLDRIRRGLERLRERPTIAHLPNGMVVQVGGNRHERPGQTRAWPVDEPHRALTGTSERALVLPTTHQGDSQRAKRTDTEPTPTVTGANRAELALVMANREHGVPRDATTNPAQTVVTGTGGVALVTGMRENSVPKPADANPTPTIITERGGVAIIGAGGGPVRDAKRGDEPMPTVLGRDNLAVVVAERNHAGPKDPAAEALDTVVGRGNHHALVVANYGSGDGPTNKQGWARHPDEEPIGTVKGRDSHALFTYRDDTARDLAEPARTITTIEQHALLGEVTEEDVMACTFRMLQPHELKLASGFTADYLLHGTKTDQVMQVGNAVTAPAEAELVSRVMAVIA